MRAIIFLAGFLSFELISATTIRNNSEPPNLDASSETPVTDGEPQSSTSENPLLPCPPDKSLHTKEDIKSMIDYRMKTLSIYNSINNSYYFEAVVVSNKHMKHITQFLDWYHNRPEHLKHNIEDLAFLSDHIEPLVKRVASSLEQIPQLQEKYDQKLNRTNTLFKKLDRYQIICENNCETQSFISRTRRSDFNGYYCSSLEDLDTNIQSKLTELAKKIGSTMLNQVTKDDEEFDKKIDALKNKLKDEALKQFGRTMYDILNLQDEYHHYIEDLEEVDANSETYKIKELTLQIDTKLLDLEQRVEKYGVYCRTCDKNVLRFMSRFTGPQFRRYTFHRKGSVSTDLVDYLLNLKYTEILNSTMTDYSNVFKELNSTIDNTDSNDIYLNDLKPIQDEVTEMLKIQRVRFDELKNIASPSSITKLMELSSDSEDLLLNINLEIEYLNETLPKQ